jgi:hypothetical protein
MRPFLLISILTLCACTRPQETTLPKAWARADSQPVNSALLDIDNLNCRDEMQTPDGAVSGKLDQDAYSRAMADDFVRCMREHGYVQIKS